MPASPLWSLNCWPIEFDMLGQQWVIPAKSAADWLDVLLDEQPDVSRIIPGWCGPECRRALNQGLLNGEFTAKQWQDLTLDIIAVATGRSWWSALNLVGAVRHNWTQVYGHLLLRGLDPRHFSLAAWLDGAYALATEYMDQKDRIQFDMALDTPPDWVPVEEAIDEAAQERAFMALMNALG